MYRNTIQGIRYGCILVLLAVHVSWQEKTQKIPRYLRHTLRSIHENPAFKSASIGIYAYNIDRKKTVCALNPTLSFSPASTLKVMTTIAALEVLGKDFRFTTKLQYDGEIDQEGTLQGNVYILGGGDPTLGSQFQRFQDHFVEEWVKSLQEKGIKKIEGSIIGDAQIYDEYLVPDRWMVEDIGGSDGLACSGLSIFDNYFKIHLSPGESEGEKAIILEKQPTPPDRLILQNRVRTGSEITSLKVEGGVYDDNRIVRNNIALEEEKMPRTIQCSVNDTAYWAAYTLHCELQKHEITVTAPPESLRSPLPENGRERKDLHTTFSPPLSDIVRATNEKSMNLYADHLLVHLGYTTKGLGNIKTGCQELKNFWAQHIDTTGMSVEDGSGTSHANMLTPQHLVEALCYITQQPIWNAFWESLPIAGKTGNTSTYFQDPVFTKDLRTKSGALSGVRSFCGYYKNKKGERIAFAILINRHRTSLLGGQKAIEKILKVLMKH